MRHAFTVAAALAFTLSAAQSAIAGELIQPAVYARFSFGSHAAPSDLRLGFRAEYADPVRARLAPALNGSVADLGQPALARLPALLDAQWSGRRVTLLENGLPVAGYSLRLDDAEEKDGGGHSNWGLNLGLALAATGAALALIINSAGHAAEENQGHTNVGSNGVSAGGGSGGSGGSNPCQVQVGSTCVNGG